MKFVIKKGRHYHSNLLARLYLFNFKDSITYWVKFSPECRYEEGNLDSYDLNKLFGAGGIRHHINSARFAWRPDFYRRNEIEIWAYWYYNSEMSFAKICNIRTGIWTRMKIRKSQNGFEFIVGKSSKRINQQFPFWKRLWPYFGGDNKAPNKMIIYLKK